MQYHITFEAMYTGKHHQRTPNNSNIYAYRPYMIGQEPCKYATYSMQDHITSEASHPGRHRPKTTNNGNIQA